MLEITVTDNIQGLVQKIGKLKTDNGLGLYAAKELVKQMEPYVPFRSGALSQSHKEQPWEVTYSAAYARPMYYGVIKGTSITYSHHEHPQATSRWADHIDKPSYAKQLQEYVDRMLNA